MKEIKERLKEFNEIIHELYDDCAYEVAYGYLYITFYLNDNYLVMCPVSIADEDKIDSPPLIILRNLIFDYDQMFDSTKKFLKVVQVINEKRNI